MRIVRLLFPEPFVPKMPPQDGIDKAIERYEEHLRTIRRVFHTLLFTELFCLVTLAVPDSQLVLSDAVVELPLLNLNVSFIAFLIVGPILIIGLTVYLHIFYGDLPHSTFPGVERISSVYALFNLNVVVAQLVVWILFYWVPVIVLGVFAWKALPHPTFGHSLVWVTLISALIMVVLQIRRCPPTWRMTVVPFLGMGAIAFFITLFLLAGSEFRFNRKLDLFKVDFSKKDLRDVDLHGAILREAMLTGANLRRANLRGTDLSGANLVEATLENTDLSGSSFVGAHLHRAKLAGAKLNGANLQYANFSIDKKKSTKPPDFKLDIKPDKFFALPSIPGEIVHQADNWVLAFYSEQTLVDFGLDPKMHNENIRRKNLKHMDLTNKSLRGADLVGYNLKGANLSGADLTGANLSGANFAGTLLKKVNLTEALLEDTNFQGAELHEAKVLKEQLHKAHNWVLASYDEKSAEQLGLMKNHTEQLLKRDFTKLKFEKLKLKGANLEQFNLNGAHLVNANLTGAILRRAKLVGTDLRGAKLDDAVLAEADIQAAHFEGARIPFEQVKLAHNWILAHYDPEALNRLELPVDHDTMLMEQRLRKVDLSSGNLLNANLSGFDLYQAQLDKSNLEGADLSNAFLAFADLSGANLTNATLDGANLTGAKLDGAMIENASLLNTVLVLSSLNDAVLTNADLTTADLRAAKVGCAEIKTARKWDTVVRDEELSCGKPLVPAYISVADSIAKQTPSDLLASLQAHVNINRIKIPLGSYERSKAHLNIGTIGHVGHGKTTLTAALSKLMTNRNGSKFKSYAEIDNAPENRERGLPIATSYVEYESMKRHYSHMDSPRHSDYVKNLIIGAVQMDGAILVVSLVDGPMKQTEEQVLLARKVGIPNIIVYLNKADLVDDEERIKQVEIKVRSLLDKFGFPGNETPVIVGSALKALEGDTSDIGTPSLIKLVEAMDSYILKPKKAIDKPFLMPVEDVFSISGRGTIATGRVERGVIKVGEEIEIVGIRESSKTTVSGVEMFRKLLDQAEAGDNVGVLLKNIKREEVERGQVLALPGSITPYTHFEAEIYVLSKGEGGRHTPFFNGYRPQFYFRTTDVTGEVNLPVAREVVRPGDNLSVTVKLITPIAMEEGLHFAIREGGRTVGAGVISKVLE